MLLDNKTQGKVGDVLSKAIGAARRYILVQLPEQLDPENKDQKIAADFCKKLKRPLNIAELTKERLRRAAKAIAKETPMFKGDLGFRVFKLDSSNLVAWDPEAASENVNETLLASRSLSTTSTRWPTKTAPV